MTRPSTWPVPCNILAQSKHSHCLVQGGTGLKIKQTILWQALACPSLREWRSAPWVCKIDWSADATPKGQAANVQVSVPLVLLTHVNTLSPF